MDEPDDIFDEDANELLLANKSWEKLENNFLNDGMRDGVIEGKENILQESFNTGYFQGFTSVHPLATLRGIISALHSLGLCAELTLRMSTMLSELESDEATRLEATHPDSKPTNTPTADQNTKKQEKFEWLKSECRKLALQNDLSALCEILDRVTL